MSAFSSQPLATHGFDCKNNHEEVCTAALMKKGLRRIRACAFTEDVVCTAALMKKGLRQLSAVQFLQFLSAPRP